MGIAVTGFAHIVDDEEGVRLTLGAMLRGAGIDSRGYPTAAALLERLPGLEPGCVITDVRMPGMDGIALVRRLAEGDWGLPVIVISGQADIALAVDAMKAGAVDFLEKPIRATALIASARQAIDGASTPGAEATALYAQVLGSLTRRQREVLDGLLEGLPNKLIAHRLGLSVRTVESYRAAIMDRTRARSLSELVRLSVRAGL